MKIDFVGLGRMGAKIRKVNFKIYCLLGDGEIQEGQVWEAAMTAAHHKLDNICAILDNNGVQENGPVYLRLGRAPFPIITRDSDPFVAGKANVMREGKDVTIIACGLMVAESLKAADILVQENIQAKVINMHTIKPIDANVIIKSAQETGAFVTVEEHQMNGGLGSAVCEVLAQHYPAPLEIVAVKDTFGESGGPEGLLKKYHLKDIDIVEAAKKVLKRK